jgi:hypothetical protein
MKYHFVLGVHTVSGISAVVNDPADACSVVGVHVAGISATVDVPAKASTVVCVPTVAGISAAVDVPADAGTVVDVPTIDVISAAAVLPSAVYVCDAFCLCCCPHACCQSL